MENQSKLDKIIKVSIVVGFLIVVLSIAYYFLLVPKTEFEVCYTQCVKDIGNEEGGCVSLCGRRF